MIRLILLIFGGRGMSSYLRQKQALETHNKIKVESVGRYVKLKHNSLLSLTAWEREMIKLDKEVIVGFDAKGKPISAYAGKEKFVKYPSSEGRKWKDGTVTHNHPDDFGGTFSVMDLKNFCKFKFREMRVVANEGVYRIIAEKNIRYDDFYKALCKDEAGLQREMNKIALQVQENYDNRKGEKMSKRELEAYKRQKFCGVLEKYYRKYSKVFNYLYIKEKSKNSEPGEVIPNHTSIYDFID